MVTDLTYLKKMTDGNPDVIREMIELFAAQIEEYTEEMKKCLDAKEWCNLANVSHKAKSSVAIMGMDELAVKLKELELLALDEKEVEKYPEYVDHFITASETALKELNEFQE